MIAWSLADGHWLNARQTLQCPVERVAAEILDGDCSACGAQVAAALDSGEDVA